MAPAFGIGLIKAWSILWTSTMIIVHDCKTELRRIERAYVTKKEGFPNGSANGNSISKTSTVLRDDEPVQARRRHQTSFTQDEDAQGLDNQSEGQASDDGLLVWQPYPTSSLSWRIDWVLDLYTNFRGMTWNWRISGPPPIPKWAQAQLSGHPSTDSGQEQSAIGRDGTRMYSNLHDLIAARVKTFVIGYLTVDALKTFMTHDAYFTLGDNNLPPPSFLPHLIQASPFLVRSYRLLVTLAMMYTALHTIFDLSPLLFAGLLGPNLIGVRGEPWAYPDTYGSFSNILNNGLAGWWGGWWHQTFRFAFESTAKRITRDLGFGSSSLSAKAMQLVIAFALSGCLHGCGSFTQHGGSSPFSGPFVFFMLQAFGITVQMLIRNTLKRIGLVERVPKVLRQTVNFVLIHAWLYFTAPLICDDFARGGIWLFEPVPFSPLRGLGLGIEGTGWWCWQGFPFLRWHQGRHWWQSGLVF
ncbi:MAG: hypothetical protein M1821_008926 [Bathelium mastoideum]|nr:MAG: hypothetical protein M1821_008926 [Bathelium mastoideum]KAI9687495.1 MAG: hypothetical protein M1822_002105 [Bathelium mastoideum]